jgi:UDP-N-acetylmuramoyl-L-alanyl-D-glutamate--2,6-diaminopimelate ligase
MLLEELLDGIYFGEVSPPFREMEIFSICCDSRKVFLGGLFVALKGSAKDGNDFILEALAKGARVVVTDADVGRLQKDHRGACFLRIDDPARFLHQAAERFFGNPSLLVNTIGITGTNGKTTITYLIESVLRQNNQECGVIGTVNYRLGDRVVPSRQTTPDFIDNQRFLTGLAWQHVPYCVMEVSSHALTQGRVYGIDFKAAVFTNLTSDHLDYHKTKEDYFSAKARLFTPLSSQSAAVLNVDDIYGRQLCSMTEAKVMTYGIKRRADVMAKDIRLDISGSRFMLTCAAGEVEVKTKLIGTHNIYNILAAASVGLARQIDLTAIGRGIEALALVPGRLERVELGQAFTIFIDYAHTQDALENILSAVRHVSASRIILVFGCGGDRDTSKRPLMGRTAGELADLVIVTSDNPRSEDPQAIIDQIIPGFRNNNYTVIVDREEAIGYALRQARPEDIVLIVGKGHEMYQVFAQERVDFNERRIIEKCLSC